jgi:hypothetical protein
MKLEEKLAKVDQLVRTIATCDDEELSAVLTALQHVETIAQKHITATLDRRNQRANELNQILNSAAS